MTSKNAQIGMSSRHSTKSMAAKKASDKRGPYTKPTFAQRKRLVSLVQNGISVYRAAELCNIK